MNVVCMLFGHRWNSQRCTRCDAWRTVPGKTGNAARVVHHLKIWPQYYADVVLHKKRFEVRKADRDFAVGDRIILREWDPIQQAYTAHGATCTITYILPGGLNGIAPDHVVLGFKLNSIMTNPHLTNNLLP